MASKVTVQAVCSSCGGTGVYQGFAEPKGTAVVCLGCNGTGCENLTYTPFEKRRLKRGIKTVRQSKGTSIISCGGTGEEMTYQQFLNEYK